MFDLDIIIITYNRPKYLHLVLQSFFKLNNYKEFRLVVLDGGNKNYKEIVGEDKLCTYDLISKYYKDYNNFFYKNYSNNGDWAKILEDYITNIVSAKSMVIVGDDDDFINLEGFKKASEEIKNNNKISICNISYKDNILKKVTRPEYDLINGNDYIKNFISKEYINSQSVMHFFNVDSIKKNESMFFLNLRSRGLEDFFGWDMHFLFFTAMNNKVKYLEARTALEMGARGDEVRYTVAYPLTQWLCYYIYSKYTVKKLIKKKIIKNSYKRIFLLFWINSFLICYSKYLFSKYSTRNEDYHKVYSYIKYYPILFIIKEMIFNLLIPDKKFIKQISWIVMLKYINPIKNKLGRFF